MRKRFDLNWQLNAVYISVILTVMVYVGLSIYAGWQDVWLVIQKVGLFGLIIALGLSLLNYGLRFGRWQYYLVHLGYHIPLKPSWYIYLSGFALTTTPAKAGEMVRSLFLNKYNVPASASLAAFVSERLSDLLAIILLSCIGLMNYPNMRLPIGIAMILLCAIWFMLMYRPILSWLEQFAFTRTGRLHHILKKLLSIIAYVQRCHSIGTLMLTTVVSVIAWGMEAWAFYWVLQWCGFDVGIHFAFFVYAISMLIGALSFLPGGLGGAEATMISLLMLKGVDTHTALAVTLFIRLTTLWFAVALGLIALLQQRKIN